MTNNTPNEGDVALYITEREAIVDAVLDSIGITTPVTATASKAFLRRVIIVGVSADYFEGKFSLDEENKKAERFHKQWDKLIAQISKTPRIVTGGGASKDTDEYMADGAGAYNSEEFEDLEDPGEPENDFPSDFQW
ncbi:MAG: hypothetical protein NUV56_00580 [Candidatus Uhrbacteria bacterium]|nr:hypothetical protein [Candidatus Uhrbacteria bacterium]